ncbi:hypothetical protein J0X12_03205 [Sneathiella sp. CAU 1612]|uniref:Uncharacterized protein n=1 Tax=Sneathiella sedimenti TaxID=2816034 RepID=A0ABS3F2C3_9PROT|nr:hypothetical protein [Sneathiella sedimenti]MBO0332605.1 hypothetical protein [Sneathiella sedimenti]
MGSNNSDTPVLQVFTRYVDWAIEEQIRIHTGNGATAGHTPDQVVISIAENPCPTSAITMANWLKQYGVLQGDVLRDNTQKIVSTVLNFFEKERIEFSSDIDLWAPQIVGEFRELNSQIRASDTKRIQNRSFLSLTSKALWCKYPAQTPIYDKNARIALYALVRLDHDSTPYNPNRDDARRPKGLGANVGEGDVADYEVYVRNYLEIYRQIFEAISDRLKNKNYEYPIRVFDKILWTYGSDSRDILHRKEVYKSWSPKRNT